MQRVLCEVWLVVDANGDYAAGKDPESAREAYENDIGDLSDAEGFRMVKLAASAPLPEPVELPEVEVAPLGEPSLA